MAGPTSKGTAHLWHITAGVAAIPNATVKAFAMKNEHANKGTTINEIGNKIEDRRDDLTKTGSITISIRAAYAVAEAFTNITYNSVVYSINSVSRAEQAGDSVVVTYEIETSEYIALT